MRYFTKDRLAKIFRDAAKEAEEEGFDIQVGRLPQEAAFGMVNETQPRNASIPARLKRASAR